MRVNTRSYPFLLMLLVLGIVVLTVALYPFAFPGEPVTILRTGA